MLNFFSSVASLLCTITNKRAFKKNPLSVIYHWACAYTITQQCHCFCMDAGGCWYCRIQSRHTHWYCWITIMDTAESPSWILLNHHHGYCWITIMDTAESPSWILLNHHHGYCWITIMIKLFYWQSHEPIMWTPPDFPSSLKCDLFFPAVTLFFRSLHRACLYLDTFVSWHLPGTLVPELSGHVLPDVPLLELALPKK